MWDEIGVEGQGLGGLLDNLESQGLNLGGGVVGRDRGVGEGG